MVVIASAEDAEGSPSRLKIAERGRSEQVRRELTLSRRGLKRTGTGKAQDLVSEGGQAVKRCWPVEWAGAVERPPSGGSWS